MVVVSFSPVYISVQHFRLILSLLKDHFDAYVIILGPKMCVHF